MVKKGKKTPSTTFRHIKTLHFNITMKGCVKKLIKNSNGLCSMLCINKVKILLDEYV